MIEASIARRYARALIALAAESSNIETPGGDSVERIGRDLATAAASIQRSPELADVLFNPHYGAGQRHRTLEQVARFLALSPLVANLLLLLSDRGRLAALGQVDREYRRLADEQSGRTRAQITSATALSDEQTSSIRTSLEHLTSMLVQVETSVDASILGGIIAQVGNISYDGSLQSQLNRLRAELKRGTA